MVSANDGMYAANNICKGIVNSRAGACAWAADRQQPQGDNELE